MTSCLLFFSRIVRQSVKAKPIVNWWLSTLNKIFASNGRLVTNFQLVFQGDLVLDGQVRLQVLPLGVWLVLSVILVIFRWVHTWLFNILSFFLLFFGPPFIYGMTILVKMLMRQKFSVLPKRPGLPRQLKTHILSFFNVSYTWYRSLILG